MAGSSWLKIFGLGLRKESKPDRQLLRDVRQLGPRRIVQMGLGDLSLAKSVIAEAKPSGCSEPVTFLGMDLFEAGPIEANPVSLRDAYCQLRSTGADVRLIPGHPSESLPHYANHVRGIDLALIRCGELDASARDILWKYLPRTLTPQALVFVHQQTNAESPWAKFSVDQLPKPPIHREMRRAA